MSVIIGIIIFALPAVLILSDFVTYLVTGSRFLKNRIITLLEIITVIIFPICYLAFEQGKNDCCGPTATFSPEHKLTIYLLIYISIIAYFYSRIKSTIVSPILEVLINSFLIIGILLNIFISYHIEQYVWFFGDLPIIILFLFQLIKNQKIFLKYSEKGEEDNFKKIEKLTWKILRLKPIYKFPFLFILCLPILIIISTFLLIFGQKPDSIIRAFTDTYKHGFSQLDYMCDNVNCGGHFLCSIAAKGHKKIVKPERYGNRGVHKIICNRQLLIANAFEELIENNFPKFHNIVRHNYNKVGNLIHGSYGVFNNKIVADVIYILMKPPEWIFLLTIYTFDSKPENRIAKQYLNKLDRQIIDKELNKFKFTTI